MFMQCGTCYTSRVQNLEYELRGLRQVHCLHSSKWILCFIFFLLSFNFYAYGGLCMWISVILDYGCCFLDHLIQINDPCDWFFLEQPSLTDYCTTQQYSSSLYSLTRSTLASTTGTYVSTYYVPILHVSEYRYVEYVRTEVQQYLKYQKYESTPYQEKARSVRGYTVSNFACKIRHNGWCPPNNESIEWDLGCSASFRLAHFKPMHRRGFRAN